MGSSSVALCHTGARHGHGTATGHARGLQGGGTGRSCLADPVACPRLEGRHVLLPYVALGVPVHDAGLHLSACVARCQRQALSVPVRGAPGPLVMGLGVADRLQYAIIGRGHVIVGVGAGTAHGRTGRCRVVHVAYQELGVDRARAHGVLGAPHARYAPNHVLVRSSPACILSQCVRRHRDSTGATVPRGAWLARATVPFPVYTAFVAQGRGGRQHEGKEGKRAQHWTICVGLTRRDGWLDVNARVVDCVYRHITGHALLYLFQQAATFYSLQPFLSTLFLQAATK